MRVLLALLALILPTPALAQDWWEAETNNFIIKSRDRPETVQEFAQELERFDAVLRSLQNLPVGEEQPSRATKLTVYRFGDITDIGRMAGVNGVAGFYIARAGDSVAFAPARERRSNAIRTVTSRDVREEDLTRLDPKSVLQHEYVHYFMMQHFPSAYPGWYVEGFAELLATLRRNPDGTMHVGDPPQYRAYQVLQMSQFRLRDMLNASHKLSRTEAIQHYGTGWLLTHYLSFDPDRRAQLASYLTAISQGEDSLAAAERIFGDLDAMDAQLRTYRRGPFPGLQLALQGYDDPPVRMRQMSPGEVAAIMPEMRLARGVEDKDAASLATEMRSVAARHPEDAQVLRVLTRAENRAKNYSEADTAAERLAQVAPDSVEAPLYKALNAIARIKDDPAQFETARSLAADAAALDRADPRPLITYYYAYLKARQEPSEAAVIALEQALRTSGTDPGYRVLLSRQLLHEGRFDLAETVLLPIAFRGHNQGDNEDETRKPGDPPTLDEILTHIRAENRDGALALFDELIFWDEREDEEDNA